MARRTKSGKELAFHTPTKRWCKYYTEVDQVTGVKKNKVEYFGHGAGVNDSRSYQEALTVYYPWKQEREARAKRLQLEATEAAILLGKLPVADMGSSPYALDLIQEWKRKGMVTTKGYINLDVVDPDQRDPENDADWEDEDDTTWMSDDPVAARRQKIGDEKLARESLSRLVGKPKQPTRKRTKNISEHIDGWLATENEKYNSKQIVLSAIKAKRSGIETFRKFVGIKRFGKVAEVDEMLVSYRSYLIKCLDNPKSKISKPNTVNDKLKFAKQFIIWSWESSVIKDQPRQLNKFATKLRVEKQGKPLELDVLHKLWDAAGPKMQAYMALALNCGFKNSDVSTLTDDMLQNNRLLGIRGKKTKGIKVPMNYPLWPLTRKLIKENRIGTKPDELVFPNSTGGQITSGSLSSLFRKVAEKAGVKATFEQLRDTSAELVRKQTLGEPGLLQIFLAHKDSSTAQYYVSNDPAQLKSDKLDKIVMGMEKTYGLKLPEAKKATKKKSKS